MLWSQCDEEVHLEHVCLMGFDRISLWFEVRQL
jgi:hypothetical protein